MKGIGLERALEMEVATPARPGAVLLWNGPSSRPAVTSRA